MGKLLVTCDLIGILITQVLYQKSKIQTLLNYEKIILCIPEIQKYVKITKSDPYFTTHNKIILTNRSQA